MSDPETVLKRSAMDVQREAEVDRVMKAFKLKVFETASRPAVCSQTPHAVSVVAETDVPSPYDVLDISYTALEADIKRHYRRKSLLIHPDKFKHPQGDEAFDQLNKAYEYLLEKSKRAEIDAIMNHARGLVLKSLLGEAYSTTILDTDSRLQNLTPPFEKQIRSKAKEVLVEDELARRRKTQVQFANEGAEKKQQEEQVAARKRKMEEKEKWEERREERVHDWRSYQAAPKKKKKKNEHVLG